MCVCDSCEQPVRRDGTARTVQSRVNVLAASVTRRRASVFVRLADSATTAAKVSFHRPLPPPLNVFLYERRCEMKFSM